MDSRIRRTYENCMRCLLIRIRKFIVWCRLPKPDGSQRSLDVSVADDSEFQCVVKSDADVAYIDVNNQPTITVCSQKQYVDEQVNLLQSKQNECFSNIPSTNPCGDLEILGQNRQYSSLNIFCGTFIEKKQDTTLNAELNQNTCLTNSVYEDFTKDITRIVDNVNIPCHVEENREQLVVRKIQASRSTNITQGNITARHISGVVKTSPENQHMPMFLTDKGNDGAQLTITVNPSVKNVTDLDNKTPTLLDVDHSISSDTPLNQTADDTDATDEIDSCENNVSGAEEQSDSILDELDSSLAVSEDAPGQNTRTEENILPHERRPLNESPSEYRVSRLKQWKNGNADLKRRLEDFNDLECDENIKEDCYEEPIKIHKYRNKFTSTQDDNGFCGIIMGHLRSDFGETEIDDDEEEENNKSTQINLDGDCEPLELAGLKCIEPSSLFSNVRGQFEIATYRMDDRVEEQRCVKGVRINVQKCKVKRRGIANKHLGPQKNALNFEGAENWDKELTQVASKTSVISETPSVKQPHTDAGDMVETTPANDECLKQDTRHFCEVPLMVLQKKTTDEDLIAAYGGTRGRKKNRSRAKRDAKKAKSQTRTTANGPNILNNRASFNKDALPFNITYV